jgi:hypothetical protein
MKLRSTILLAVGLVALSACGGGTEANTAANNVVVEDLNVSDDLSDPNLLGEDLNAATDVNAVDANVAATENEVGNAQ